MKSKIITDILRRLSIRFISFFLHGTIKYNIHHGSYVFGDKKRVSVDKTAKICNSLLNTASGNITIEKYVLFGHNVSLITGTHDYKKLGKERIFSIPQGKRDIIIKTGVWVGSNVTVIGPCIIGENSVIAAGAVVNKDVPANTIYGGVPAKKIKDIIY